MRIIYQLSLLFFQYTKWNIKHVRWHTYSVLIGILCSLTACTTYSPTPSGEISHITTVPSSSTNNNKIALLVPLSGNLAPAGEAIRDGFFAAYYNANSQQRPSIVVYDSGPADKIVKTYQQALDQGATMIVGPLDKQAVQQLRDRNPAIPILALNYTDNDQTASPTYFYEFGQSPQNEAQQVAEKARQTGYKSALTITPAGNWGQNIAQAFQTRWTQLGGKIVGSLNVAPNQDLNTAVKNLLQFRGEDQRRTDADVIFLAVSPELARQIRPLLKFYFAGDLPVYATSYVYSGTPAPDADRDIDKVIFCDMPWAINNTHTSSPMYNQLANLKPSNFKRHSRLYGLGIDAYQLINQLKQDPSQLPAGYAGVTGTLRMAPQHRILQELQWAQFQNGVPVLTATITPRP